MRAIEKSDWAAYCERVTRGLIGKRAEIEVDSLQLGAQIQAEWVPIIGLDYDPKDDLFEVALEGLDHLIYRPRRSMPRKLPPASTSWPSSMAKAPVISSASRIL